MGLDSNQHQIPPYCNQISKTHVQLGRFMQRTEGTRKTGRY